MRVSRILTALCAVVLPLALAAPAAAAVLTIEDPAGDGLKGRRLDITEVTLANRDRAIVLDVQFVRASAGDLAIYLQARGTKPRDSILVLSRHRPQRGDRNAVRSAEGLERCKRLRVTWDHDADTARVRLPSRCLLGGDYGAVRTRMITELPDDADVAPERPGGSEGDLRWTWSDWTARG